MVPLDFSQSNSVTSSQPKLLKVSATQILLLRWNVTSSGGKYGTKMVKLWQGAGEGRKWGPGEAKCTPADLPIKVINLEQLDSKNVFLYRRIEKLDDLTAILSKELCAQLRSAFNTWSLLAPLRSLQPSPWDGEGMLQFFHSLDTASTPTPAFLVLLKQSAELLALDLSLKRMDSGRHYTTTDMGNAEIVWFGHVRVLLEVASKPTIAHLFGGSITEETTPAELIKLKEAFTKMKVTI